MRRTLRLLANVKPARYLEPGIPTGLTGLYTHSSPRSSLLFLYNSTLDKLKEAPETSLYRQSVEALTKHRMSIVAAAVPPGHKEWQEKTAKILEAHPEGFNIKTPGAPNGAKQQIYKRGDQVFMIREYPEEKDDRFEEWDGEVGETNLEGLRSEQEKEADLGLLFERQPVHISEQVEWEAEPQLTAAQIEEIEANIGGGLIEEVIQVAESELHLADIMTKNKVWEDLEEKPVEGQWMYFDRP